jgi:hypothetical protein
MLDNFDETPRPVAPPAKCPNCEYTVSSQETHCPLCGSVITPPASASDAVATRVLKLRPLAPAQDRPNKDVLDATANVILQFLPSETCVSVPLHKPLILGRGSGSDLESLLDLTDFGAFEHGVSRQHCLLQRRGNHLHATDLGSTNGTSLNGQPMLPHRGYQINHGDRLALGTLPMLISFGRRTH